MQPTRRPRCTSTLTAYRRNAFSRNCQKTLSSSVRPNSTPPPSASLLPPRFLLSPSPTPPKRRESNSARASSKTTGQYKAEEYQQNTDSYSDNNQLALLITVDETFDHDHRIVNQKGSNKGRFTFTASDAGEHRICFWASHQSNSGWSLSHSNGVRLHLDLAIGETSEIESKDKDKIADIVQRVKDLSGRLQDIRREQVFQRVGFPPRPAVVAAAAARGLLTDGT